MPSTAAMYPQADVAHGVPIITANALPAPTDGNLASAKPAVMPADHAAAALRQHDAMWAHGLCGMVSRSVASHPLRIVILDNSGSMRSHDGKRLVAGGHGSYRTLACSRWQELVEDVISLANVSDAVKARTDLHLLNPVPGFSTVSLNADAWKGGVAPLGRSVDVQQLTQLLRNASPTGTTPLTESVMTVVSMIQPAAARLRADGQAVSVVLCTDGLPDNKTSFVQAMRLLQTLPVWCVVRLCTDDDDVVDFWNDLDRALEAPLEVLDDVRGEAAEVVKLNPWLTYGPPLHLARLFGLPEKLFDELDEAPLVPSQIKAFLGMLFGLAELPEPELDKEAFLRAVRHALEEQPPAYDPRSGKLKPWVDMRALERSLRPRKCGPGGGEGCAIM